MLSDPHHLKPSPFLFYLIYFLIISSLFVFRALTLSVLYFIFTNTSKESLSSFSPLPFLSVTAPLPLAGILSILHKTDFIDLEDRSLLFSLLLQQ